MTTHDHVTPTKIEKATLKCKLDKDKDVGMYILKNRTSLKNSGIGGVFGVSESGVNKGALHLNKQIKKQKH